jgi:hypothetical protein
MKLTSLLKPIIVFIILLLAELLIFNEYWKQLNPKKS